MSSYRTFIIWYESYRTVLLNTIGIQKWDCLDSTNWLVAVIEVVHLDCSKWNYYTVISFVSYMTHMSIAWIRGHGDILVKKGTTNVKMSNSSYASDFDLGQSLLWVWKKGAFDSLPSKQRENFKLNEINQNESNKSLNVRWKKLTVWVRKLYWLLSV